MIKNAEGIEAHITDSYIHWSHKNRVDKMKNLRELYDKALSGNRKALDSLLSEVFMAGIDEARR